MSTAFQIDQFRRRAQRRPQGLGFGPDEVWETTPVYTTPPIAAPSTNRGWVDTWLGPLLMGAEKLASNIWAPASVSIAQAGAGQQANYQQYGAYQPVYRAPTPQGVGISLTSQGIRLSDGSTVGWLPIVAVIGGFMLLQARPISRR